MKCCAPVPKSAVVLRSRTSSLDARCLRNGKVLLGGKWFCRDHARLWRTHYAILARIRAL